MITADTIVDDILKREGGYVDRKDDAGGPTNHGITIATLSQWRNHVQTAADVQALTENEARDLYREMYINRPGFNAIQDPNMKALIVDCAVNHGVSRAQEWLKAVISLPQRQAYARVCAMRVRFYGHLVTAKPSQAVFAEGWANRVASFVENV